MSLNKSLFVYAFIFLLPITSIPWLPSVYRPLSLLIVLLGLPYVVHDVIRNKKIGKIDVVAFGLFFYGVVVALCYGIWSDKLSYSAIVLNSIPYLFFFLALLFLGSFLRHASLEGILKAFHYSFVFFLLVCSVELACIIVNFDTGKQTLNLIFSDNFSPRLQGTTREASWAARIAVLAAIFYFSFYRYAEERKYLLLSGFALVIFMATFSMEGIVILLSFFVIYLLAKKKIKLLFYFAVSSVLSIVLFDFIITQLITDKPSNDLYYAQRWMWIKDNLRQVNSVTNFFKELLYVDGSVFVRIAYPLVALTIFLNNPLGIGFFDYSVYFSNLIFKLYPESVIYGEVLRDATQGGGDPRNLLLGFLAIFGIVGIFFIVYVLKKIKNRLSCLEGKEKELLLINLSAALASTVQFGSFAYMNFWVWVAICLYFFQIGTSNTYKHFRK